MLFRSGTEIIKNFLDICGIEQNWSSDDILQQIDAVVEAEVKDEEVLLALSGGVDSTVLAAVLHRTLGNRLTCVMVDHGLLRKDEAQNVLGLHENKRLDALHEVWSVMVNAGDASAFNFKDFGRNENVVCMVSKAKIENRRIQNLCKAPFIFTV